MVPMIDTQLLNDALMTVALMVGLVVVISAWVVAASALHWRHTTRAQIRTIEEHLAHIAEQSPTPVR
jgi:type II secretory pathway component PulK